MDFKMGSAVIILSLAILAIALTLPSSDGSNRQAMPWQIEHIGDTTRVFGLTLGRSTLRDAEEILLEDSEISLFQNGGDATTVEAYFDKVELGGLTSKMILVLDIPATTLSAMFRRGVRISKASSGSDKVRIATQDLHLARMAPIQSITYLPAIHLDARQLRRRFGNPAQRVKDPRSTAEHWLYPAFGLDVALDDNAKEILQYVRPSAFARIAQPLALRD